MQAQLFLFPLQISLTNRRNIELETEDTMQADTEMSPETEPIRGNQRKQTD